MELNYFRSKTTTFRVPSKEKRRQVKPRSNFSFSWWYWPFFNLAQNAWRYYPFTHVCNKLRSCDLWFLKYKVQQTDFFHFGLSFAILPCYRPRKSKFWTNQKKGLHFTHVHHKWQSHDVWFLRYWALWT